MHANASGVSLLASNKEKLLEYANSHISDEGLDSSYMVDYIFSNNECFSNLGLQIAMNEDLFGNDIEAPMVIVEDIPITNYRIKGSKSDTTQISHNGVDYMKFLDTDFADGISMLPPSATITVYGKLSQNTYAGRTTCQIIIDDYEIHEEGPQFSYTPEDYEF